MHTSNKKRHNLPSVDDWEPVSFWDDYGYDDNCTCSTCIGIDSKDELHKLLAETVADTIIREQNLNTDIRERLIDERMETYTRYTGIWQPNPQRLNEAVKEDIAFVWKFIKDTERGAVFFSMIFGQKE